MISPAEVKDYTVFDSVKERADVQLSMDIIQAQQDIFSFAGHKFTDEQYSTLPTEVKLAFIKLTEFYALTNSDESLAKGIKTEKIGDYQYSLGDGGTIQNFSLETLLSEHVQTTGQKRMRFKMRSL